MRDFRDSYAGNWHCLEHIWVGFPLPHDISSNVPVKWKVHVYSVRDQHAVSERVYEECYPALNGRFFVIADDGLQGYRERFSAKCQKFRLDCFLPINANTASNLRKAEAQNPERFSNATLRVPQVMRADVGSESEWSAAAPKLDSYVACASNLSERFSSTGKMPDHPLLSTATSNSTSGNNVPPSSPPSNTTSAENGERYDDPRGSPGAPSPGVRSPGFPPSWLGQGGRAGRRRRASTSVGKSAAKGDKIGGGGGGASGREERGGEGGNGTSAHRASPGGGGGGAVCSILVASPPRPRSRSTAGRGAIAAGGAVDGNLRPRTSKKSADNKCVEAGGVGARETGGGTPSDGEKLEDVESPAAQEADPGLLSPSPGRLPV